MSRLNSYSRLKLFTLLGMVIGLTSGCAAYLRGSSVPTQYSLDGVKRIALGLSADDSNTWAQTTYRVDSQSRLLLRFETLGNYVTSIDTTGSKKVEIQLTLSDASQIATALTTLKLCPVTKSWMMLASWEMAHPFGGGDRWATVWGDYDLDGCVLGSQVSGSTKSIVYNVTQWFLDYPKGRLGTNYGLIAVSSDPFDIVGDQSGTYSPRISFEVYATPTPSPYPY